MSLNLCSFHSQVLAKYGKEWIIQIKDVTDFVKEQYEHVKVNKLSDLVVAEERVYLVTNARTAAQIRVDTLSKKLEI